MDGQFDRRRVAARVVHDHQALEPLSVEALAYLDQDLGQRLRRELDAARVASIELGVPKWQHGAKDRRITVRGQAPHDTAADLLADVEARPDR